MERDIVTVYCLIDEFLKIIGIKEDPRAKVSNAEILLVGYLAVSHFNGNYYRSYQYIKIMGLCNMVEYSRFLRRLISLQTIVSSLFSFLGKLFCRIDCAKIYSVDSFPVEMCSIAREKRVRLWNDHRLKGYNASKKRYFYGLKVHMVVTTHKEPIVCTIIDAKTHDVSAGYKILSYLPKGSIAIGDKGYVSKKLEDYLQKCDVKLSAIYRKNMKIDSDYSTKRKIRKGVETAFSQITAKFGQVVKATSMDGFLTKLKLFITAYSIDKFLQLSHDKQSLAFN